MEELTKKRADQPISSQQAQEEVEELLKKAKGYVQFAGDGGIKCPICRNGKSWNGCSASSRVEGNMIVYGINYNDRDKRGFYGQGNLPIPKYLRDFF